MKKLQKRVYIKFPCRATRIFLQITLPILLITAIGFLLSYLEARTADPVLANDIYPPQLEYILASLTLTAGGALLLELVNRDMQ